jgi:hypothetical protein
MKKWEYKVVSISVPQSNHEAETSTAQLNNWGAEGWELVQIIGVYHYFKRERR